MVRMYDNNFLKYSLKRGWNDFILWKENSEDDASILIPYELVNA